MAKRRLHPGDRVRHFIGGPVMQVQHYELDKRSFLNLFQSDTKVVCAWTEGNQCKKQVFDQDVLIKLGDHSAQSPNYRKACLQGQELSGELRVVS